MRDWLALALVTLMAGHAAGQGETKKDVERRARSLTNQLELADRRVEAVDELLALGKDAVPALAQRLKDPRPEIVQVVCRILCLLGPSAAAAEPELMVATGSPQPIVANMARMTLFAIRPSDELTFAEYAGKRLTRLAADETEQALLTGKQPWDFDLLPDGHFLVALYLENKVVEFDAKGQEIWSFADLKRPLEADRLLDGNTLICDTGGARVIEIDPQGTILWEYKTPGATPYDVERLPNGRTLITTYPSRVFEVDRDGKVVWQLEGLEGVFDADRLANGNTLLTLYRGGSVQEVNRKGEVVWETKQKLASPNDADRLPNGNTLVSTNTGIVEIAPDGTIVREVTRGGRISEASRR